MFIFGRKIVLLCVIKFIDISSKSLIAQYLEYTLDNIDP